MRRLSRKRLQRVFASLGFDKSESDEIPGLDDHVIGQLIGMSAEGQGYRMLEPAEPTDRLRRLVADFAGAVRKSLDRWGLRHEPWFVHGEDGEELYYDDGPYAVLMTLRGEGVGVWDGRWEHHFKPEHAEQAVRNLKVTLQKELRRWADDTGGGVLTAALEAEAARQGTAQNPETEDDEDDDEEGDEEDEGQDGESAAYSGYDERRPSPRHGVPAPYIAPPRRRR